jgi:hypothetical protein
MFNVLADAAKSGRRVVAAFIATTFAQTIQMPPAANGGRSPTGCGERPPKRLASLLQRQSVGAPPRSTCAACAEHFPSQS